VYREKVGVNVLTDHRQQRIREAEEAVRQRDWRQELGEHLHGCADWVWWGTIGFRHARSAEFAEGALKRWIKRMEQSTGCVVDWAASVSRGELNGRTHIHVLIAGVEGLDLRAFRRDANMCFGDCKLELYDAELGGAYYLAKNALAERGELLLGGPLFEGGGAASDNNSESGRRGPGRPRVTPPDPRVIDYFRRRGMSWRAIARMWNTSTGTLQRTYDEWLKSRGWTRAEIRERYRTSAPGWRKTPTRDKTPPRRSV